MATANARGGRRRWMLHEEARAAAGTVQDELLAAESTGRKYDFDSRSASYAVAMRLLPQRLVSIWGALAIGVCIVVGLAALDVKAVEVRQWLGVSSIPAAQWSMPSSLGAWFSNLVLIGNALLCLLVFGLRRHRLDDYRGQYRRWLAASVVLMLANLMRSTGLHSTLAAALAAQSGISAMPGDAIWWLVPTCLVGGWVFLRVALDMRPCRLGLSALVLAAAAYCTALAAHFAPWPITASNYLQPAILCSAHLWLLMALLAQVRFIKLDAAGEISTLDLAVATPVSTSVTEPRTPPVSTRLATAPAQPAVVAIVPESRKPAPVTNSPKQSPTSAVTKNKTEWTDGRDARDHYEDDDRPLSKAERKRLRKEARRQAA